MPQRQREGMIPVIQKIKRWVLKPLLADNYKVVEGALIALAFWWSFILILPMETFNVDHYHMMKSLAPEGVWALVFFVVGATNFYGMVFERLFIRMTGIVLSASLWLFISGMFAVSNIATTATGTYFIVFCLATYVAYKAGELNGR